MNLVSKHILKYLDDFISEPHENFNRIFEGIHQLDKAKFENLLCYLDRILDQAIEYNNNVITTLHLHFEKELSTSLKLLIAEFISIKLFYIGLEADTQSGNFDKTSQQIRLLERKIANLAACPDGASGKNGGNKIYKNWQKEKKETTEKLLFFKNLPINKECKPLSILNVQEKTFYKLIDLFKTRAFISDVHDLKDCYGYVVLNDLNFNELRQIKVEDEYLLRQIKNLLLFDCESSVKKFVNFNFEFLSNLNRNHNANFRNLQIITFNKNESNSNNIKNKIELVKNRFKIPSGCSYSLLPEEIEHLTHKEKGIKPKINFFGENSSTFWDVFLLETSIRGLYELRSIKMLNIYSFALDQELKQYILENIFSVTKPSKFLTFETQQVILESSDEDLRSIRESLSQTLDLIIQSNWKEKIRKFISDDTILIISADILKNLEFKNKIICSLGISFKHKIYSWGGLDLHADRSVLILAYQDQGRFPYYFYPNLIESIFVGATSVNALFLRTLFALYYEWAEYNLNKEKLRLLNHPIRKEYFHWGSLESEIKLLKPKKLESTNWDFESEYSNPDNRTLVKVKFKKVNRSYTFSPSDLFITKFNKNFELRVLRIIDLLDINITEEILFVQNLDEIQDNINIYEKFIDIQQQDEELKVIRKLFNIDETEPGRLWKILLKLLAQEKGEFILYDELKTLLSNKNLKIVSFYHFQNSWINPDSVSMTPLNNKIFIELCDYLGIPRSYFIIMQRIKNASKQATRHSTRQMNNLLKDLFNDGCFDHISKARSILELKLNEYKKNHPLEEIGIDESYLLDNLVSLVELIKPEIKLQEVEKIEIVTQ